jgi:phosphoribulokinase
LRPTVPHPNFAEIITDDTREAVHLKLTRDADGRPIDAIHVHGYAPPDVMRPIEKAIWEELGVDQPLPEHLGMIDEDERSESLALIQLILLFHVIRKQTFEETPVPKP